MDRLTQEACYRRGARLLCDPSDGISKSFANAGESLEVLKNINLTVAEQAIVGLLGASGSGKSTLLNIISGIVKPDRGLVCICGAASDEFNDWCAISYMFQDDRLLPWRTAFAMSNLLWRRDHCPKRNVPGARAKR